MVKNNTVSGHVVVAPFGGNSCNSEYEFLTGNAMGFYPPEISAYVELVNDKQETLVTHLKKFGYRTYGFTGARKDLWNAGNVYVELGWDEKRFAEDLRDLPTWRRSYPTDHSFFQTAFNLLKTKPKGTPGFIFITTMQNHGPYRRISHPTVKAVGYDITAISTFLTGLKMTDDAIKALLTQVAKEEEDYVVVFYGDHYPVMNSFTDSFLGSHVNEVSEEMYLRLHSTPFFIWTNYESKTELNQYFGLTHLSTKVMEIAGIPKSQYMQFHDSFKDRLVCFEHYGYCGANGTWYPGRPQSELTDIINDYGIVQHYMMNHKN